MRVSSTNEPPGVARSISQCGFGRKYRLQLLALTSLVILGCAEVAGLGSERRLGSEASSGAGAGGLVDIPLELGGSSPVAAGSVAAVIAGAGGQSAAHAGSSNAQGGNAGTQSLAGAAGVGGAAGGPVDDATPVSCAEIKRKFPEATSGVYNVRPLDLDPFPKMAAYCDHETDGGGWTLVLNYLHKSGKNPPLVVLKRRLPILGSSTLGEDESTTIYFGHAASALIGALKPVSVRFYGATTVHPRVIHFKSSLAPCIKYLSTGIGSCTGLATAFTPLDGHSSVLPALTTHYWDDQDDYALTEGPFYRHGKNHWLLRDWESRWEVDDFTPDTGLGHTLHRVFVR